MSRLHLAFYCNFIMPCNSEKTQTVQLNIEQIDNMSIRSISRELQLKASTELNEVPSRIEDDIKQIRDWLEKQPHLRARTDDQFIINFLRCSKYSIERAKERLDFFYTMRTLAPEVTSNRDPFLPEIQDILKKGLFVPLAKLTDPAGPLVVSLRMNVVQAAKNPLVDLIRVGSMFLDVLLLENNNLRVSGIIVLDDIQGFSFNYITHESPGTYKKLVLYVQNAYPIRIKQVYCFNLPSYFQTILNLFMPFLTEKLKKRITICGKNEFDKIYKNVPLSVLPTQYGGTGGCLDEMAAEWKKKIESYREWFLEDAQYFSDETKKPGKPRTSSDIFGVEGSFRKLDLD